MFGHSWLITVVVLDHGCCKEPRRVARLLGHHQLNRAVKVFSARHSAATGLSWVAVRCSGKLWAVLGAIGCGCCFLAAWLHSTATIAAAWYGG
ncbi:hypothetical protein CDL15_Pgr023534 [Punica granatum]|uniref:Uncharacterized protein n=1 Tax=Punica granatum TaxID=22663 RepID=A0A218W7V1_PUNGR|nr:hypothetical protein CDL15_Pgr023534 [Punica granatum]